MRSNEAFAQMTTLGGEGEGSNNNNNSNFVVTANIKADLNVYEVDRENCVIKESSWMNC